jgi:hypothetical protein
MALFDPANERSGLRATQEQTKHPGICLRGFFSLLIGSALGVHFVFQALVS